MNTWTADKAFEIIHRVNDRKIRVDENELIVLRKKFVEITVFGKLKYDSATFQIWQDKNKDIAYINRDACQGCVVLKGVAYVVSE